jgi:peptidoglycan DL-endopeptidase CwlO
VERSHRGSGLPGSSRGSFSSRGGRFRTFPARPWQRGLVLAAALIAFSLALPLTSGDAQPRAPRPSFNELVAQARLLAHQIDTLSQEYDGLQVRLTETRSAAKAAAKTAARDMVALAGGMQKVSQIATESYVSGGYDPTLQLATSSDPQGFIDRASIMSHLQSENGAVVHGLQTAEAAANRAQETAQQQAAQVATLVKQMAAKKNQIQGKINLIESSAYKKALAIANQTGRFPVTAPVGDSLGARALRFALSKQGDPYVWGAAGPDAFDCSGLVMWAYEQIGIQLPHYTGDQWNSGVHVSRNQLEPGDLVFFYPDIGHVGLYIGNGLMLDAPDFGQTVHVEQVYWNVYIGAVRIAI